MTTKHEKPNCTNLFFHNTLININIIDTSCNTITSEIFDTLIQTPNVRIERIISKGHRSEDDFWYDQDEAEWVLVLKGAARLQFEDGMVELRPGDHVNIAPHQKHRVDWTTPDEETVWLAVFY